MSQNCLLQNLPLWQATKPYWVLFSLFQGLLMKMYNEVYFSLCLFLRFQWGPNLRENLTHTKNIRYTVSSRPRLRRKWGQKSKSSLVSFQWECRLSVCVVLVLPLDMLLWFSRCPIWEEFILSSVEKLLIPCSCNTFSHNLMFSMISSTFHWLLTIAWSSSKYPYRMRLTLVATAPDFRRRPRSWITWWRNSQFSLTARISRNKIMQ